jgi:hypothetical protein
VFRSLQCVVYSNCVQKSAARYVQQMCSEDCHTLHTGVSPRWWFCSFAEVYCGKLRASLCSSLIHGHACVVVQCTVQGTDRMCRPVSGTWIPSNGMNYCSRVLTKFGKFYHLHADGQGSEHCSVRTPICSERIDELFHEPQ